MVTQWTTVCGTVTRLIVLLSCRLKACQDQPLVLLTLPQRGRPDRKQKAGRSSSYPTATSSSSSVRTSKAFNTWYSLAFSFILVAVARLGFKTKRVVLLSTAYMSMQPPPEEVSWLKWNLISEWFGMLYLAGNTIHNSAPHVLCMTFHILFDWLQPNMLTSLVYSRLYIIAVIAIILDSKNAFLYELNYLRNRRKDLFSRHLIPAVCSLTPTKHIWEYMVCECTEKWFFRMTPTSRI